MKAPAFFSNSRSFRNRAFSASSSRIRRFAASDIDPSGSSCAFRACTTHLFNVFELIPRSAAISTIERPFEANTIRTASARSCGEYDVG